MNTSSTTAIGQGIMDLWEGKTTAPQHANSYQKLDKIVTIISIIIIGICLILCYLLIKTATNIYKKRRQLTQLTPKKIILLMFHSLLVAILITAIFMAPEVLLGGLNWTFIKVWAPTSISVLLVSIIMACILYLTWGIILIMTKRKVLD